MSNIIKVVENQISIRVTRPFTQLIVVPMGPRGAAGVVGSQIFTGNGVPSNGLGIDGDFYLNNSNGDYYKKAAGSWGSPLGNLTGPAGSSGAPGSQIFTGNGTPSNGLGIDGDFYLNNSNGDYYKKASGVWGSPQGNLTGPQGPQGPAGVVSASPPLSLSGANLSITQAGASQDGYLSSLDWNVFNNKQPAGSYVLTSRLLTANSPLTGGGDLSSDRSFGIQQSDATHDGYLSQTDWNTFNNKVPPTRAVNTTAPLTGGGALSSNLTLAIPAAGTSQDGYLSQTDWNTFNNKAPTNSPAFTGVPTAPTASPGTSTTQLATTAFVLSQGFSGASGSIPFAHQSSTSVVTNATATYSTAISTTVTVTASSAPIWAIATAVFTVTGAVPTVLKYRVSINGVAGQEQLLSLTAVTTNYTAAVEYISAALGPGTYTILFEIARNSGTGTVSFFEGTLDAIALQGASSNGITQITGLGLSVGPGSGAQTLTGTLSLAGGGTNASLVAANGAIPYSTASALALLAPGTLGQLLRSGGAGAPTWTSATFPSTTTINQLLYSSAANVISGLATANTGALVTSSTGVPSITSGVTANRVLRTNGTTVSFAQVALATDVSGTLPAANGGTGHGNWANQQIPFGTGTSLSGDPLFLWDTVNTRLQVGGGGGTAVGNFINGSGSHVVINAYNYGGNNCIQAIQQNNNYNLSMVTFSAAPVAGVLLGGQFGRGTIVAPAQSLNGDIMMTIVANGTTATGATSGGFGGSISFTQTEDCTSTANGADMVLSTTPNGTNTPVERLRLKQSGESVFSYAVALARYTTAAKNALTPTGGWVVFDTDLAKLSYYNGTTWINL